MKPVLTERSVVMKFANTEDAAEFIYDYHTMGFVDFHKKWNHMFIIPEDEREDIPLYDVALRSALVMLLGRVARKERI